MTFKELKQTILDNGKRQNACSGEYKRALETTNKVQLLKVVKENFSWYYSYKVITIDLLDQFGEEFCNKEGIYYKGEVDQITDRKDLIFCGKFECEMLGNSQVGKMWGQLPGG